MVTVTRQQVLDLYNGLGNVSNLGGAKFAYAVAKNIAKLKPEIDSLQKAYAAKEAFLEFDKERAELAKSHAVVVDGKPQTYDDNGVEKYQIKDQEKFDTGLKALEQKHTAAIEERKQQLADFDDLLTEETAVDLFMIDQAALPETITAQQTTGIMLIIKE